MKNEPLAAQFRRTLIMIVAASAAAAALTYALAYSLFTQSLNKDIYPADYYERQIPGIEAYVQEKSTDLLAQEGGAELESVIRGEDMSYQVVDKDGNIIGEPFMGGIDDQSNYDQLMKQIQSVLDQK